MKKIMLAFVFLLSATAKSHAQIEIIGEVLKRVVMAIDLRVQRLQTQTIVLQDAQRQLDNIMQATHLADIADWVQQQKNLYNEYYQELWQVKNVLQYYSAVKDMINKQARLVSAYKQSYAAITRDSHFSAEEIAACLQVYQKIIDQSAHNIDELSTVIQAFTTQMPDADRLRIINELSAGIDRNFTQLQSFTQQAILLSLQRARDMDDMKLIKTLYGIQ